MTNWVEFVKRLDELLKPETRPIGAKFMDEKDFPEKTRRPKDFGVKMAVCQAETIARRYGWSIGLTAEDVACPPALAGFGWKKLESVDDFAKLMVQVGWVVNEDMGRRLWESIDTLEECAGLYIAPLERFSFDPDSVVIYCNAAQLTRLIQAATYLKNPAFSCNFVGKFACGKEIISVYKRKSPQVVVPGAGVRVMGGVQDHEASFAFPPEMADEILQGLEKAGAAMGMRHPPPTYLLYQPRFPKMFAEFVSKLK